MAHTLIGQVRRGPSRLLSFIKEAREELKKVAWPDRQTTIQYTIVVVFVSVGTSLVIGGLDWALQLLLEQVI
ncbi:MAG: preprotein translocase subunit SecE [Candidatus Andersenbacteria bacterium CG10_big_fil_rev_8_21_14_0_10_54_11]|uniref:Protein translocase subunit SecE n=1 Tax=Candidatus Andersenbacteria bacterium CG10_big_fil_rev_8_21_14_0_10_54_11 TaxID=1974485 RepID=A0A2M6WZ03_9BACT|nr:MAG: preprotein translocase subunit SecE [Candidatus Andersenbacteria bacterium CG10_big_fil_rev_8_21_14_0_10_54_11]